MEKVIKLAIIVRDNTSLKKCIEEQVNRLDITQLKFKDGEFAQKKQNIINIYSGLVHYFLTNENGITQENFIELLANTKWAKKGEMIYDPQIRKFCNFIGVITKEFKVSKKDILLAAQEKHIPEIHGNDKTLDIKLTLQIISRFDTPNKPYFLQTMLLKGKNLGFSNQEVLADDEGYFDFLLMALFKQAFLEATNKGYYKTYHNFDGNDNKLKGTIDFDRHIRENIGLKNGNIAYSYRENSIINYMNMIILAAYECLKSKYTNLTRNFLETNSELVNRIDILKYSLMDNMCDLQVLIAKNLTPISHPYYHEYDALRDICLKILRNEGMGYEEEINAVQGILYYIPGLWEEYLYDILNSSSYELRDQHKLYVFDYTDDKEYRQLIKPDFVFFDKEIKLINENTAQPFMILDAKFKRLWWIRTQHKTILGKMGDYSLMSDYDECVRNMNNYGVNATGVIFPATEVYSIDEDEVVNDKKYVTAEEYREKYKEYSTHSISIYNKRDHFYTFPIFVPDAGNCNYEKWMELFEKNNKIGIEIIKEIIECEHEKIKKNIETNLL